MRTETSYPYEERDPIREERQREAYIEALADARFQAILLGCLIRAQKEKSAKPEGENQLSLPPDEHPVAIIRTSLTGSRDSGGGEHPPKPKNE